MRIDAHQHFWDLTRLKYAWMPPPPSPLARNYMPEDLAPILKQNRFDGSVVVQANTVIDETHWLLGLAETHPMVLGVVGWVDLTDPNLGATLDTLQKHPKFKGVRHPVHDETDLKWLIRPDVIRGLKELARRHIPYDLLLRPPHLRLIPVVADGVPDLKMVLDHIGKPPIASGKMEGWTHDIQAAAKIPQVCCKLSGMITEADPKHWKAADLQPYVKYVFSAFGPDRLMFGSDWPVCLGAGSWKQVLAAFTQALGPLDPAVRAKVIGGTAAKFYNIAT